MIAISNQASHMSKMVDHLRWGDVVHISSRIVEVVSLYIMTRCDFRLESRDDYFDVRG